LYERTITVKQSLARCVVQVMACAWLAGLLSVGCAPRIPDYVLVAQRIPYIIVVVRVIRWLFGFSGHIGGLIHLLFDRNHRDDL
jgi:hypothetical protein